MTPEEVERAIAALSSFDPAQNGPEVLAILQSLPPADQLPPALFQVAAAAWDTLILTGVATPEMRPANSLPTRSDRKAAR